MKGRARADAAKDGPSIAESQPKRGMQKVMLSLPKVSTLVTDAAKAPSQDSDVALSQDKKKLKFSGKPPPPPQPKVPPPQKLVKQKIAPMPTRPVPKHPVIDAGTLAVDFTSNEAVDAEEAAIAENAQKKYLYQAAPVTPDGEPPAEAPASPEAPRTPDEEPPTEAQVPHGSQPSDVPHGSQPSDAPEVIEVPDVDNDDDVRRGVWALIEDDKAANDDTAEASNAPADMTDVETKVLECLIAARKKKRNAMKRDMDADTYKKMQEIWKIQADYLRAMSDLTRRSLGGQASGKLGKPLTIADDVSEPPLRGFDADMQSIRRRIIVDTVESPEFQLYRRKKRDIMIQYGKELLELNIAKFFHLLPDTMTIRKAVELAMNLAAGSQPRQQQPGDQSGGDGQKEHPSYRTILEDLGIIEKSTIVGRKAPAGIDEIDRTDIEMRIDYHFGNWWLRSGKWKA